MGKGAGGVGSRGGGGGGGSISAAEVTSTSQISLGNPEGMRPESFAYVRAAAARGQTLAPIEISIFPDLKRPVLQDGRHRLSVARERGDKSITATIRTYGPRGGLRGTVTKRLKINH